MVVASKDMIEEQWEHVFCSLIFIKIKTFILIFNVVILQELKLLVFWLPWFITQEMVPPPSTYIQWPSHCTTEPGRILLGADTGLVIVIQG